MPSKPTGAGATITIFRASSAIRMVVGIFRVIPSDKTISGKSTQRREDGNHL